MMLKLTAASKVLGESADHVYSPQRTQNHLPNPVLLF
ncbi:hypothetical protein T03_16073 [Trichinella britovi]|uniref:Uncharacterized protein n=1 Tax=Trichinella britovi TaxID=45882 RepID=A0A0V0YYJ5_TRIBR|nr:hypothetical protein T03_16073 [Trichinella britovi]